LFEPVLQHVIDVADIVTSNTMKQSGSKKQENKEEENNELTVIVWQFSMLTFC